MTAKTEISLDKYASKGEAEAARSLVHHALLAGYTISVSDGEEWTVKKSRDRNAILEALATTGEDYLRMRTAEGESVGTFQLVYQDGDRDELIADHTDNDACNALYKQVVRD